MIHPSWTFRDILRNFEALWGKLTLAPNTKISIRLELVRHFDKFEKFWGKLRPIESILRQIKGSLRLIGAFLRLFSSNLKNKNTKRCKQNPTSHNMICNIRVNLGPVFPKAEPCLKPNMYTVHHLNSTYIHARNERICFSALDFSDWNGINPATQTNVDTPKTHQPDHQTSARPARTDWNHLDTHKGWPCSKQQAHKWKKYKPDNWSQTKLVYTTNKFQLALH